MSTPESRRQAKSARVGGVLLVLTAAGLWLTFKAQTGLPFAPSTEVSAAFDNIHSLKVNDDVRQNSKRIGRISDVEYDDGTAVVTMKLDGDREVYADARAVVWDQSALATKFIDLDPGTPSAGKLGERVIGTDQTANSHDLYEFLDVFDPKTRSSAQTYLRNAGGGMAAHGGDLQNLLRQSPDLLADVGTLAASLASREADLPGLLRSSQQLAHRFSRRTEELGSLIDQSARTLDAVSADSGRPLAETVRSAPGTLRTVRGSLEALDAPLADTHAAMRSLRAGAEDLGRSTPDLRAVLRSGARVAPKMSPVLEQAEPVIEDMTRTLGEARPLGPRVTKAFLSAAPPLRVLAPYAPEIATWAVRGRSFLSQGPAPGIRFARLAVIPAADTITGGLLGSGNYRQNEYPSPGEAMRDRTTGGLPAGLPFGGSR